MRIGGIAAAVGGGSLLGKLFGGDGKSSAPQIDPRVGENAHKMSDIGKDTYAWNLAEANRLQPLFQQLSGQTGGITNEAIARGGRVGAQYDSTFAPVNQQVASDAMTYDSPAEMERAAGSAVTDTASAFNRARENQGAYFARFGANPANFASQNWKMNLEQAKAEAGAANGAREARRMGGIQLRTGAANLGRGILSDATSQSALGLSGAGATGGIASQGMDVYNQGTSAALPWYTGANQAMLGINQQQQQAYSADQQRDAAKWGGIGQLAGTIGGFALAGPLGGMLGDRIGKTVAPSVIPGSTGGGAYDWSNYNR